MCQQLSEILMQSWSFPKVPSFYISCENVEKKKKEVRDVRREVGGGWQKTSRKMMYGLPASTLINPILTFALSPSRFLLREKHPLFLRWWQPCPSPPSPPHDLSGSPRSNKKDPNKAVPSTLHQVIIESIPSGCLCTSTSVRSCKTFNIEIPSCSFICNIH